MTFTGDQVVLAVLVGATWLHLGFQLTVSVLVYPTLLVPTALAMPPDVAGGEEWARRHDRHSRGIVPVVGFVYGALVVACLLVLVWGPRTVIALVAVGACAVAGLTTALVAAPTHGRLSAGRDPVLETRLLRADYVRLAAAVVAAVASALAVVLA